jgi:hypothetical protein
MERGLKRSSWFAGLLVRGLRGESCSSSPLLAPRYLCLHQMLGLAALLKSDEMCQGQVLGSASGMHFN